MQLSASPANAPRNLRRLRESVGLSIAELARKTHISRASLNNYESGARGIGREKLEALADFFSVDPRQVDAPIDSVQLDATPQEAHVIREGQAPYGKPRAAKNFVALSLGNPQIPEEALWSILRACVSSGDEGAAASLARELARRNAATGEPKS